MIGVEGRSSPEVEQYLKSYSQLLCTVTAKPPASPGAIPSCQVTLENGESLNSKVLSMLPAQSTAPNMSSPQNVTPNMLPPQNRVQNTMNDDEMLPPLSVAAASSQSPPALSVADQAPSSDVNARLAALEQILLPLREEVLSLRKENAQLRHLLKN